MAIELGTPGLSPALWGQGLISLGHPSPLCFAQKQVVGIIVESATLRDGPPLDVNQGQGEERRKEERISFLKLPRVRQAERSPCKHISERQGGQ